ncbi:hypothetical protein FRB99_005916 [Tulasnella sp. 403]|nr:hypothetical protein FRB99_005916 [Tulasnella sp. 403]
MDPGTTTGYVGGSIGGVLVYTVVGHFSAVHGRRPWLIIMGALTTLALTTFIAFMRSDGLLSVFMLGIWLVIDSLGHPQSMLLLGSMFAMDVTDTPASRTEHLARLSTVILMAKAPSYFVGGLISKWAQNVETVWYIAWIICASSLLYAVYSVPESLPQRHEGISHLDQSRGRFQLLMGALRPLLILKPTWNHKYRTRNMRLPILACGVFVAALGSTYIITAYMVYSTSVYHLRPDETGATLSFLMAGRSLYLVTIFPAILKLRSRFNARFGDHTRLGGIEEANINTENSGKSQSSKFDLAIMVLSITLDAFVVMSLPLTQNKYQLGAVMMLFSFGAGYQATLTTVSAASCDPTLTGEVVAGLHVIAYLGDIIGVLVLGSVLASTIDVSPGSVFILCSVVMLSGSIMLSQVKDRDRWNA